MTNLEKLEEIFGVEGASELNATEKWFNQEYKQPLAEKSNITNREKFIEVYGMKPHDEYCPVDCRNEDGKGGRCNGCKYDCFWDQEYKKRNE